MSSIRQTTAAQSYATTLRPENGSLITSGRAGNVLPIVAFPMLRGDSGTGRVNIDMELAEMPAPLENAVLARAQAWMVPRPALPQFEGPQEYLHSYQEKDITKLNSSSRTPPSLFDTVASGAIAAAQSSEFFETLGIYLQASEAINTDYIDAYNLIQNFRLAAYSNKMTRYNYYAEDPTTSLELKPAFWPRNRVHQMVPDYDAALVKGSLDLDVAAGQLPIAGLSMERDLPTSATASQEFEDEDGNLIHTADNSPGTFGPDTKFRNIGVIEEETGNNTGVYDAIAHSMYAELSGQSITASLADIDMARKTNLFARTLASMRGSDYSGFNNDDVIVAELMAGFQVDEEFFNRPWLLDSKTVVFGITERHATDSANLDDSVVTGRASIQLSLNIPQQKYGGVVIATVEIMPERLFPRMADEYLYMTTPNDLPNALRDSQITEPVDTVPNRRIDAAHTTPDGPYAYEPMNSKWRREFTRMGGEFRSLTPGAHATGARTQIWQPEIVDPVFNDHHWVCPHPFPQDVFSVEDADVVNVAVQHAVTISGITQFGDELMEDNNDFLTIKNEA